MKKNRLFQIIFNLLLIAFFVHSNKAESGVILSSGFPFDFTSIENWFLDLGKKYNVNPWIFGSIYVGAIPFFSISIAKLIKNIKNKKPLVLPALSAGFFFISAYLYLIVVGKNVPLWVYGFVLVMVIYGVYTTIKKIRKQIEQTK